MKKAHINKTPIARKYKIAIYEGGNEIQVHEIRIDDILFPNDNDFEHIYALMEVLEDILYLKPDQSMYFQPNRDNKNTKGILLRII
jgi:hypothetical protein